MSFELIAAEEAHYPKAPSGGTTPRPVLFLPILGALANAPTE
jgi:hypothetical protein